MSNLFAADPIQNRYDFIYLFDVRDGNPNGDPDAGNLPRIDAETGEGLVTDVSLKRKVRNYVALKHDYEVPFDIFVREGGVLNDLIKAAHKDERVQKESKKSAKTAAAKQVMCERYYDIRTFGAVLSTGENAGQVRGPVQFTFGRSLHPVVALEHSITRMASTDENEKTGENRTMGRKYTIPYGLYMAHGFISAAFAKQTGFNEKDLELLWEALVNMFDQDRSAARGEMSPRAIVVFKHDSYLGNAPANRLFEMFSATPKTDTPRSIEDFDIKLPDASQMPQGVSLRIYTPEEGWRTED